MLILDKKFLVTRSNVYFIPDGYDTSSNAIAAALYELARDKRIQSKLREEIKSKMPNEEDFTYDNIISLDYLDQVWHGEFWNFLKKYIKIFQIFNF